MSIFAFEPPVLTTETTWVALPTEFANQGVAAPLTGASTRDAQIRHTAAHSEASSRRMDSIVGRREPHGQVKLQTRFGNCAVITGAGWARSGGVETPTGRAENRGIPATSRPAHRTGSGRSTPPWRSRPTAGSAPSPPPRCDPS